MLVNGKKVEFKEGLKIEDLIARYDLSPEFIVVELDGKIIPREDYSMTLKEDSVLELVSFVGGG